MKQMDIKKKRKQKAQRFIARATYSLGELEKRTDKVSRSEAKAIAQACSDFGGRIKPVAAIFKRDRRTVSSVLAKTELYIAIMAYKRLREGQQESEQLRHLAEFLSQWGSELPLPLNYLDNQDLSMEIARVSRPNTIQTGITIMWDYSPGGPVVRRFWVEDAAEFRLMQKYMPHSEVWGSFSDCKQLGGKIITACSALARDIRERSEKQTGLQIVDTGKLGLDRFFAWTIYADTLDIFTDDWKGNTYYTVGERDDLCNLRWGDYILAAIKRDAKDAIEAAHRDLRARYRNRECRQVSQILQLKEQLHQAETLVCKELDTMLQAFGQQL